MGVKFDMKKDLFSILLEKSHPAKLKTFEALVKTGHIKPSLTFSSVVLAFPKKPDSESVGINLSTTVTSLMKTFDPLPESIQNAARKELIELLDAAFEYLEVKEGYTVGLPDDKPAEEPIPVPNLDFAVPEPAKVAKKAPAKPTTGAVKLREAKAIGQQVLGTSSGSKYYAIALSERVKLAARVQVDGHLSLRAEGNPTPAEDLALKVAGMQKASTEHYSLHFMCNGVQPARVLGAFLLGLGIKFDDQLTHSSQIKGE